MTKTYCDWCKKECIVFRFRYTDWAASGGDVLVLDLCKGCYRVIKG